MASRRTQSYSKRANLKRTRLIRSRLTQAKLREANLRAANLNSKEAAKLCRSFAAIPCQPTESLPGTREKLDVMASRIEAGEELWNQDDGPER